MSDPAAAPPGPRGIPKAALVVVGLAGIGLLYGVFGNPPEAPQPSAKAGSAARPNLSGHRLELSPQQLERAEAFRSGSRGQVDAQGKPMGRPIPESVRQQMQARLAAQQGGDPAQPMDPAQGARAREDVGGAIKRIERSLADCYLQGLKASPALAGEVTLAFTLRDVDGGGGAEAAAGEVAASTLNSPDVEACMLSRLKGASFPALHGEGEVKVRYPFKLSPDQATPHP